MNKINKKYNWNLHEGVELVEVSVDSDAVSSYFSSVVDWSPNTSLVFGEGDPELDGLKIDVEGGDDFHLCVDQILACFYNVQAGVDPMICGVPLHAKVLLIPLVMLWEL